MGSGDTDDDADSQWDFVPQLSGLYDFDRRFVLLFTSLYR